MRQQEMRESIDSVDQDSVYSMTFASDSGGSCYNSDAFESEAEDPIGSTLPDIVRKASVGSVYSLDGFESSDEDRQEAETRNRKMSTASAYSMDGFESDEDRQVNDASTRICRQMSSASTYSTDGFESDEEVQPVLRRNVSTGSTYSTDGFESDEEVQPVLRRNVSAGSTYSTDGFESDEEVQPVLRRNASTGSTYSTDGFESDEDEERRQAFPQGEDGERISFKRERTGSELSVYSDTFEEEDAEEVHVEDEEMGMGGVNLTISTGQEPEDEEAYCEEGHSIVIGGVIHRPLSPLKPAGIVDRLSGSPSNKVAKKTPHAGSLFGHRPPLMTTTSFFKFADLLRTSARELSHEATSGAKESHSMAWQWLHYWTNLHRTCFRSRAANADQGVPAATFMTASINCVLSVVPQPRPQRA
jgi:hypothetical protein